MRTDDQVRTDLIEDQRVEIERLKKERDRAYGMGYESAKAERNAIIEECAMVVRDMQFPKCNAKLAITSAIRALKDKPDA